MDKTEDDGTTIMSFRGHDRDDARRKNISKTC